jgi:hypothetical protein
MIRLEPQDLQSILAINEFVFMVLEEGVEPAVPL